MIQPAPVLPSNGSPLLNADDGRTSRVLQEQSNNRQTNDYSYVDGFEQKYSTWLSAENSNPYRHQQSQPQHIYRQTPLQRNQYRHSSSGYRFGHGTHDARAFARKQAAILFEHFQKSDQYMKYRNRQHKDDKNGQEQKWPDHLELAFLEALVYWPPMGRRQLPHKDKRRGRNELIADYIEELTGESRSRKQVSSHIQVLKPFVEHDHRIMKWLSKDDMGAHHHHARMYGGRAASYHNARRSSCYPAPALAVQPGVPPAAPMVPSSSYELSKVKGSLAVFEPTEFQMFKQRKLGEAGPDQIIERLYDYTASITNPRQEDETPEDLGSFSQAYPFAASLLSHSRPDCNIILAEASLAFPTQEFKDPETGKSLNGVELGISFMCKSRYLDINTRVRCRNTFYIHGVPQPQNKEGNTSIVSRVDFTSSEDGGIETQLKFGSFFWARQLASLASTVRKNEEEVRDHIRNINAYQEVFIETEKGHERLLVICWSFRLSRDIRGKAYWRRLELPEQTSTAEYIIPKTERVDSVYDYNSLDFTGTTTTSIVQPSLQSPFEYDNSSSGGSVLPSATWPTHLDAIDAPHSAFDFPGPGDNAFDFSGGNINISYTDPSIMDFSNFDSSAFNFDTTADFVADPNLQNYSTQDSGADSSFSQQSQEYSQQTDYSSQWCDSYTAFESQQPMSAGASNYAGGDSQYQAFDSYSGHYDHGYSEGPSDGQAYGGAGQDVHGREEDPLSALANASYMRVNVPTTGGDQQHQTQG